MVLRLRFSGANQGVVRLTEDTPYLQPLLTIYYVKLLEINVADKNNKYKYFNIVILIIVIF